MTDNRFNTYDPGDRTDRDTSINPEDTDEYPDDPVDEIVIHKESSIVYEDPMDETIDEPMDKPIPYDRLLGEANARATPGSVRDVSSPALLKQQDLERFRTRWSEVQSQFVDDPHIAVQQADALISEVIGQISQLFILEHRNLESQWKQDKDVSTEDLRIALQRYRSFFNRLLV